MDQPQSYPIIFKELQVSSYAQLIEVLNFNFSRIANSPLFRGKIGHTGDDGVPGVSGIRGNRLMFVNIDTWNSVFEDSKTIKDFIDTDATVELLNSCMNPDDESGRYEKLKIVLGLQNQFTPDDVNILLEFDWVIMPNGGCYILQNNYNANGDIESQYWVFSKLTLMTSDNDTLQQTIEDMIAAALRNMTIGTMKLYTIAFHVAQDLDDPEVTAGNNGNPKTGAIDIVVDNDECHTNATASTSSTQAINALTDDKERTGGRWPLTVFGSANDWYRTMQNTLPAKNSDNIRRTEFTPSQSTAPSGTFFQDNDYTGILLGKRPIPIYDESGKVIGHQTNNFHDFANIVRTPDGLLFMPKFSRWQNESTKYFDEYMSKVYLSTRVFAGQKINPETKSDASTSDYRYTQDAATIKRLQSYVYANDLMFAGYQEVPDLDGDVSKNPVAAMIEFMRLFRFYEYVDAEGKTVIKPAVIFGDEVELVMPNRMAKGILMTKDRRVQLAGFDGDNVADIRHVHRIPGVVAYEPLVNLSMQTITNTVGSDATVYTVIVLPSIRMKLEEQLDIHVLVESLTYCMGSAGLKTAELLQETSWAVMNDSNDMSNLQFINIDTDRYASESIVTQSIEANSSFASYDAFAKKAIRTLHSYIIDNFTPYYESSTGSTLPARLVIRQHFTLKGQVNVSGVAVGSPKVTALPMLTDIGIDRHDIDPIVVYVLKILAQNGFNVANIALKVNNVAMSMPAAVQVDSTNNEVQIVATYETSPGSGKSYYDTINKTVIVTEPTQDYTLVFNRSTFRLIVDTTPSTATVQLNGSTVASKYIDVPSESNVTWSVQVARDAQTLYTPQSGTVKVIEKEQHLNVALEPFVRYTINPMPNDATVKFTVSGTSYNDWARIDAKSAYVPKGSNIAWTVSKSGYGTASGTITNIQTDLTETKQLTPYVTLTIVPTPSNATVQIDGQTRKTITVLAGTTVSWSVNATGYAGKTGSTKVDSDMTLPVDITDTELEYTVKIKPTPADATVTLNGRTYPNNTITVTYGSYVDWVVSKTNYKSKSGRIENITENKTLNVSLGLVEHEITFNISPSTALVYIDGESTGHSNGYKQSFEHGSRHTYRVAANGYDTKTGNFTVTGPATIEVNLVKTSATVTVSLSPSNATLTVAGKQYSNGDKITGYNLYDSFSWSCSADGYDTKTGTKTINTKNDTLSVSLSGTERTVTFNLFPTTATINVVGVGTFKHGESATLIENQEYRWTCSATNYYSASEVVNGLSGSNTGLIKPGSSNMTWKVILNQDYSTITIVTVPTSGVSVVINGNTYKHNDKLTAKKGSNLTWSATCTGYDPINNRTFNVPDTDTSTLTADMNSGGGTTARTVIVDTATNNGSLDVSVIISGKTYKNGDQFSTTKGTQLSWSASATNYYTKTGTYTVPDTAGPFTLTIPALEQSVTSSFAFNIVDENNQPLVANLVVNGQTYTGQSTYTPTLTIGSTAQYRAYKATSGTIPDSTWNPYPADGSTASVVIVNDGSVTIKLTRVRKTVTFNIISSVTKQPVVATLNVNGSDNTGKSTYTFDMVLGSTLTWYASNGDDWNRNPESGTNSYTVKESNNVITVELEPKGGIGVWVIGGTDANFAFIVQ